MTRHKIEAICRHATAMVNGCEESSINAATRFTDDLWMDEFDLAETVIVIEETLHAELVCDYERMQNFTQLVDAACVAKGVE